MVTEYQTIETVTASEYVEKYSRFLSFLHPCQSIEDAKVVIAAYKKEHPKARHYCFAYQIGAEKSTYRAYDDGEPTGSAGMPILQTLKSQDLTNVLLVVVRYFGGIQLGKQGLTNAYKQAARQVVQSAMIVKRTNTLIIDVVIPSKQYYESIRYLKDQNIRIIEENYLKDSTIRLKLDVPLLLIDKIKDWFDGHFDK